MIKKYVSDLEKQNIPKLQKFMENKKYYHHFGKFPTNNGSKVQMRGSTFWEKRLAEDPSFDFITSGDQFKSAINSSLKIQNDNKWKIKTNRGMQQTLLNQRRKNYSTDYTSKKMLGNTTMMGIDSQDLRDLGMLVNNSG